MSLEARMEALRRAISLPLLCRQDVGEPPDLCSPGRPAQKPAHRSFVGFRIKAWSRLIDSRNGNRVHPKCGIVTPCIHGNHIPSEGGSDPPNDQGSSVDLAPTLMTIYDNYATANGNPGISDDPAEAPPSEAGGDGPPATLSGDQPRDQSANQSSTRQDDMTLTLQQTGVAMEVRMTECEGDGPSPTALSEGDGPPAALAASPQYSCSSDLSKKRPLSISSTSSSTSSTSSLPRQQRKKIAGVPMSPTCTCSVTALGINAVQNSRVSPMIVSQCNMLHTLTDDENEDYTNGMVRTSSDSPCSSQGAPPGSTSGVGVSYIDKVVAEILATERTYVNDLSQIIEGYLHKLRDTAEPKMDPLNVEALFGNIEAIHDFNRVFLEQLESCQQNAELLAKCFVEKNEGFVIYTDYCTNYPRAVEILTDVMRNPVTSDVFKRHQVALCHNLPLGAYLLKPVQRILKYHLLLENILSHMADSCEEFGVVSTALSSMTNMAQHINEMKRKHERTVHIQEIQSQLDEWDGEDLTTYGDLLLEDTFRMHGAKAYRHLLLFEKGLLIAKRRDDSRLLIKGVIMCSNLMLIESIPGEPLSFHVIPFDNPRHQHTVQAKSLDQKRQWCLELKRLILENYNAVIPDKAKELVMALGKSRDEQKLEHDGHGQEAPSSGRKSLTAPQYLEKRRTRRKSATLLDFGLLKSQKSKKATQKEELESPKLSPRVVRRKSEGAVHHEKMQQLLEKQNKREQLEDVDDVSDTDSAGRSRSMESLQSSSSPATPSVPVENMASLESEAGIRNGTAAAATQNVTVIRVLPRLDWPDTSLEEDDDVISSPTRKTSPLKRTESFRIATVLNRVDSEKRPVQSSRRGPRPAVVIGAPSPRGLLLSESGVQSEQRCRTAPRKPRRVSDGDFPHQLSGTSRIRQVERLCVSRRNQRQQMAVDWDEDAGMRGSASQTIICSGDNQSDTNNNPGMEAVAGVTNTENLDNDRVGDDSLFSERLSTESVTNGAERRSIRPASAGSAYRNYSQKPSSHSFHRPDLSPVASALLKRQKGLGRSNSWNAADNTPEDLQYKAVVKQSYDPRRCRTDLKNGNLSSSGPFYSAACLQSYLSANIGVVENNQNVKDPWILRSDLVVQNGPDPPQGLGRLRKFNSFSSLSESREDVQLKERKGHKRLTSETLVFTNRNAFIAAECPRMIWHDIATERLIARLATPPRELGPADLIQQVKESQEHGRVVLRYATPPRTFSDTPSDSALLLNSGPDSAAALDLTDEASSAQSSPGNRMKARSHSTLPADMRHPEDSPFWQDFEEFIEKSPESSPSLPKFPVTGSSSEGGVEGIPPPDGFGDSGRASSPASSAYQSPTLSSPSSVMSTDSLVDSLKQAVCSLTSKLSKWNSRSVESSPSRTPRTRSISALEELRLDHLTEQEKVSDKRKDKRSRFVYHLARAYSDRIKKRTRSVSAERKPHYAQQQKDSAALTEQIAALLRDSKQGSSVIGERMAASKPIILGTYTLPRHRPRRPKQELKEVKSTTENNKSPGPVAEATMTAADDDQNVVHRRPQDQRHNVDGGPSVYDSGCLDVGVRELSPGELSLPDAGTDHQRSPETMSPQSLSTNPLSGSDDDDSSIYYYERKFVEDLESNFGDEAFRDSAVYSDDGNGNEAEQTAFKVSIKEAVKLIEQRTKSKPVMRQAEVKRKEKSESIKEILKNLEGTSSSGGVQSVNKSDSEPVAASGAAAAAPAGSDKVLLKSIRDRTRELVQCAALTRIRQTACQISDDAEHREPSGGHQGNERESSEAGTESSPPSRRGWVKEVVNKLQSEQE